MRQLQIVSECLQSQHPAPSHVGVQTPNMQPIWGCRSAFGFTCPNQVGAGRQASGDRQEDSAAGMVS